MFDGKFFFIWKVFDLPLKPFLSWCMKMIQLSWIPYCLHKEFKLCIFYIFLKSKFHQLKSSYKEDCLQSITELWHISKLTFTVIPVKIIPVKRSKFDFWGIFRKTNSLKKVNLGPGACLLENANVWILGRYMCSPSKFRGTKNPGINGNPILWLRKSCWEST